MLSLEDTMNVLIKPSILTIVFTVCISIASAAIASPSAFKTSRGEVIITGLVPTQRYQIRTINAQDKPSSRQDRAANRCGEVIVDKASNYKLLVVGQVSVEPANLPVREYEKCKRQNYTKTTPPTGVERATIPGQK